MDEDVTIRSEINTANALVETYQKADFYEFDDRAADNDAKGAGILVVPKGREIVDVEKVLAPYRAHPVRRRGTATFTDTASLAEYVKRFADPSSVLFADEDRARPSITAILDYNLEGSGSLPRFGEHRARHSFILSDEWLAWHKADGMPMGMGDFAAFLEDRIIDVLTLIAEDGDKLNEEQQKFVDATGGKLATPGELLKLSVGLKVHEKSVAGETRNLASGEGEGEFRTQHETSIGAEIMRVPTAFLLAMPAFRNGPLYRVLARLRYRKTSAGLVFWYQLWRTDRVFDHAFRTGCEFIRVETALPLFYGKPR